MEFVHESVERDFRLETSKSMVRSDHHGILIHCALSCVGVFVTRPTSGLSLYYTAQALGSFKVNTCSPLFLLAIWLEMLN